MIFGKTWAGLLAFLAIGSFIILTWPIWSMLGLVVVLIMLWNEVTDPEDKNLL